MKLFIQRPIEVIAVVLTTISIQTTAAHGDMRTRRIPPASGQNASIAATDLITSFRNQGRGRSGHGAVVGETPNWNEISERIERQGGGVGQIRRFDVDGGTAWRLEGLRVSPGDEVREVSFHIPGNNIGRMTTDPAKINQNIVTVNDRNFEIAFDARERDLAVRHAFNIEVRPIDGQDYPVTRVSRRTQGQPGRAPEAETSLVGDHQVRVRLTPGFGRYGEAEQNAIQSTISVNPSYGRILHHEISPSLDEVVVFTSNGNRITYAMDLARAKAPKNEAGGPESDLWNQTRTRLAPSDSQEVIPFGPPRVSPFPVRNFRAQVRAAPIQRTEAGSGVNSLAPAGRRASETAQ